MSDTHRIHNRQTKDPHPRQGSISGIQKGNSKELHDSVSTDRQSQTKPCRTGNTYHQESLQINLSRINDTFPMRLWDRLLPQTIQTLNLLRQSNAVPMILAWQYVHRNFDYNKMPLAPMGCVVQIYQSSEIQTSWGANAIDRLYFQMSPEHYQCHVIYVKQTKSERVSDTVFFNTKYITHSDTGQH
jgi:hypothetical protein